jgi:hypothetical protein
MAKVRNFFSQTYFCLLGEKCDGNGLLVFMRSVFSIMDSNSDVFGVFCQKNQLHSNECVCYLCGLFKVILSSPIHFFNYFNMNRAAYLLAISLLLIGLNACKQDTPNASADATTKVTDPTFWKQHGCDLVSNAEVEKIFAFDGKATFLNARTLPDQVFCLRTWKKPDWKERENANEKSPDTWLNPENRLVIQVFDYTEDAHSKQQMEALRRDRRNTYEADVTGVGEDGLWSTSTVTLLARKGQYMVSVTLEYFDNSAENLPKAKEVAALALSKL